MTDSTVSTRTITPTLPDPVRRSVTALIAGLVPAAVLWAWIAQPWAHGRALATIRVLTVDTSATGTDPRDLPGYTWTPGTLRHAPTVTVTLPATDADRIRRNLEQSGWTATNRDTAVCLNAAFDGDPVAATPAGDCTLINRTDHTTVRLITAPGAPITVTVTGE